MEIKINGRINRVYGTATFEELKVKLKKPHKCTSCGVVACVGGRNLKNAAIKDAIKTENGLYVISCDNHTEDKRKRTNVNNEDQTYISSPFDCSIAHPTVKRALSR